MMPPQVNETIVMNDSMTAPIAAESLPPEAQAALAASAQDIPPPAKPKLAFGLPKPVFQMAPIPDANAAELPTRKPGNRLPGVPVSTLQQGDIIPLAPEPNRLPEQPDFRGLTAQHILVKHETRSAQR
jgi:hypothetical protein